VKLIFLLYTGITELLLIYSELQVRLLQFISQFPTINLISVFSYFTLACDPFLYSS